MNGTEIITFLSTGIGNLSSAVGAVAGAIFTAIFLRSNTKTEEFEKIKAGQLLYLYGMPLLLNCIQG